MEVPRPLCVIRNLLKGAPMNSPERYLNVQVPEDVRALWHRWEGAEWRKARHRDQNNIYPPDQRFNVRPPDGMCRVHRKMWIDWRNHQMDSVSANRWPGHPGSPFVPVGDIATLFERRRCEWDEETIAQMQLTERICLSGTSPQCDRTRA
jgi:hypothetical protein